MAENRKNSDSLSSLIRRSPELLGLLVIACISLGVVGVAIFYLPLVFAITTGVVFVVVLTTLVGTGLRLARNKLAFAVETAELRSLIENVKDGVLVYDLGFKIIDTNKAFEEIARVERKNLVGKVITPALLKNPELSITTQIVFPSLAPRATQTSEGGSWPQTAEVVLSDPQTTLLLTLNQLLDSNGLVIGFIKIVGDETREKAIIESKSEFIKVAAHQLRTPLTAIRWAFENLARQENSETKDIIEEGLNLSERSLKIVNDLLMVSEIEEGRFGLTFKKENVNMVVQSIVEKVRPVADEYGIGLTYAPSGSELFADIDAERIALACSNMLDNAIRYNAKTGTVSVIVDEPSPDIIRVSVRDTGAGIPKSEIGNVFSKFYRGQNISDLEPNGSGLGLYVAKNIVERHGGEIGIESEPGRGTVVWFTLPKAKK